MKQTEKKYRSLPFWSWNDELEPDKLVKQIEWMDENGIGGFFMHARGGLKTEYLGEKWFECVDACTKRAKELGMEAYAYDENGWPSGFVGGKLLEDIENHDKYLTYTIGEYDASALVSYDISGEALIRDCKESKNCLNIYEHYSTSTADILNPEVVDKFLEMTHEEYRKRDNHSLKGFFTDEPQYYRWGHPYTKVLPKYFYDTYGEDIHIFGYFGNEWRCTSTGTSSHACSDECHLGSVVQHVLNFCQTFFSGFTSFLRTVSRS